MADELVAASVGHPDLASPVIEVTTKISVLICTRDRPDSVGEAIESVARCEHEHFDLHVLDQSTDDKTRHIVHSLISRYADRCTINYHHLDQAGLSRAYNEGVRVSDGPIIACTDDDVIVPTNWLTLITAAFEGDPDVGLLYGQVLLPERLEREAASGMIIPTLTWSERQRLFSKDKNFKVWGMGANMAFRRTAFDRVGGFDEMMGGGAPLRSSQDYDFALRVYRAGLAVLLEPDVRVDHYGSRTPEQWPVTMRNYGIGDGAFYSKHVRCGDLVAARLLLRTCAKVLVQMLRRSWRERRPVGISVYGRGVTMGIREASHFAVDRSRRLYRPTATSDTRATEANPVSSVTLPRAG